MAHNVFSELGGVTHRRMNEAGKSMLLYKIIEEAQSEMKVFHKASKQRGFVDIVADAITEFKKYNITPEILKKEGEEIEEAVPLPLAHQIFGFFFHEATDNA